MKTKMIEQIRSGRIVPVVVLEDDSVVVDLADALLDAGLGIIEITFRTAAAASAIATLASKRPQMFVGSGTLLTTENIRQAVDAGAKFGVAPGLNERMVGMAQQAGLEFVPGITTPSEMERALSLGCPVLKFFPAELAGGAKMLEALEGPYGHTGVQFVPTGGISAANMKGYLTLKCVAAVGGSWFVNKKLIASRDWKTINQLTREALGTARNQNLQMS